MLTVVTATLPERLMLLDDLAEAMAAQTCPPARWIIGTDSKRDGQAATLNALVDDVDTEWFFPIDDDDLVDPRHFEILTANLEPWADVVFTLARVPAKPDLEAVVQQLPFDAGIMFRLGNTVPLSAAIRTESFRKLGGFSTTASALDHDLWKRGIIGGWVFRRVPVVTWTYRLDDAWAHASAGEA